MNRKLVLDLSFALAIVGSLLFIQALFFKIPISGLLVITYALLTPEKFKSVGLTAQRHPILVATFSIPLSVGIILLGFWVIEPTVAFITKEPMDLSVYRAIAGNRQALIFNLIIAWVIGGLLEELIFRGFFLRRIIELFPGKIGPAIGVILTSIMFGYLHQYQGITGQLFIGVIGVLLGMITLANKGRIWMSIATHGMVNTLSMLSIYWGWIDV